MLQTDPPMVVRPRLVDQATAPDRLLVEVVLVDPVRVGH